MWCWDCADCLRIKLGFASFKFFFQRVASRWSTLNYCFPVGIVAMPVCIWLLLVACGAPAIGRRPWCCRLFFCAYNLSFSPPASWMLRIAMSASWCPRAWKSTALAPPSSLLCFDACLLACLPPERLRLVNRACDSLRRRFLNYTSSASLPFVVFVSGWPTSGIWRLWTLPLSPWNARITPSGTSSACKRA